MDSYKRGSNPTLLYSLSLPRTSCILAKLVHILLRNTLTTLALLHCCVRPARAERLPQSWSASIISTTFFS
ncbi:hypothetical protein BGX38DRAFT_1176961 [Terfezia claveryi]|nr:hypothetical protein BGX38DRAFT_1176961 [Terfezia claveryi]